MSTSRRSRGRQKIEIKKISNESNLQVTFSKRRGGLFKKASELCTLCGVDVAIIVFSPGDKVFSFGHPTVDSVINRYLTWNPPQNSGTLQFIDAHRSANVHELNAQLTQINNQLDIERKCGDELSHLHKEAQSQFWWASPIEKMNVTQLEQFKMALEELKKNVTRYCDRLLIQGATGTTNTTQFSAGSSSCNNPSPLHQPPSPLIQFFPPQFFLSHMFDGTMMHHHGFNNMGGYTPTGFF